MKDSFHCCLKGSYDLCKGDEDDDSEDHEDADNNEEDCAGGDHDGAGSMTDLTRNGGSAMRDASDDIDCKARKHNENSNGADRKGCSSDVDKNGDDSGIKNTALFDEMLAFVQDLRSVKEQNGHSRSGGDEKDVTSVGTDAASPGYSTRLEVELLLAYLSQNRININVRQVEDKMNYFTAEQKGEQ